MPSASELADRIAQIDLSLKNQRDAIQDLRRDIQFPHAIEKRRDELMVEYELLEKRMTELEKLILACDARLDKSLGEATLQTLTAKFHELQSTRIELYGQYEIAKESEASIKSVAPDMKQFQKLAESLPAEELQRMLQEILLKKTP